METNQHLVTGIKKQQQRNKQQLQNKNGPTHRAQFAFIPRHDDELFLEIGDALHVERQFDDHWCYG